MVEVIYGDYTLQPSDQLIGHYRPDILFKQKITDKKTIVMFAEDCGIDKKILEQIKDNAQVDIKIITSDKNLFKNFRSSKSFKITKNAEDEPAMSPFDLAKAFLVMDDRNWLVNFLISRKENLYMPIKVLASSYKALSETNKKVVMFLDKYFGKASNEILYYMIAFNMERQRSFFPKWNFPKKDKKDD